MPLLVTGRGSVNSFTDPCMPYTEVELINIIFFATFSLISFRKLSSLVILLGGIFKMIISESEIKLEDVIDDAEKVVNSIGEK